MRETKKAVKIISELMTYFFDQNAKDIEIKFHSDDVGKEKEYEIIIEGFIENISNEELTKLRESLNTSREAQVEEYYWELAGEGNNSREMSLVGMLVDNSVVEYKDNYLKITLWRQD
ncbi:MAG: hypothetical protein ACOCVD_00560 [Bacillota bacterium]